MDAIPVKVGDGTVRNWCPLDEMLYVLADSHRRALIAELEMLETATVNAAVLTERLAARLDTDDTTELELALHHRHLPQIEATGLIEYDEQAREIRYFDCPFITPFLSTLENQVVSREL